MAVLAVSVDFAIEPPAEFAWLAPVAASQLTTRWVGLAAMVLLALRLLSHSRSERISNYERYLKAAIELKSEVG